MAMNAKHKAEMNNIVDCFTGADGGAAFINLQVAVELWESEDSESSRKLLEMISNFSRLIDVVSGLTYKDKRMKPL